ncbi:MAG: GLPGLI family protein [Ferruginibacter sp.]
MKILYSCLFLILFKNSNAQENVFIGKVNYVKETKLLSGEYVAKNNGESDTYFNSTSYAFVQNVKVDINGVADRAMLTIPNQVASDSFEVARQREKIKKQIESQISSTSASKTFIDFKTNVAHKPRIITNNSYCVIDTLSKIVWELKEDTMTIDGLLCQKARGFFIEKFYTVWFAASVPYAAGPLNMHGLPGVIVLATSEDDKTRYRMKSINYPLQNPVKITGCNGGKQISPTEFLQLQAKGRDAIKQSMEDYKNKNDKN